MYFPNNYEDNTIGVCDPRTGLLLPNCEVNKILKALKVTRKEFKELCKWRNFNDNPYGLANEDCKPLNFIEAYRFDYSVIYENDRIK